MSYYIPVLFLPIARDLLPAKLESWLDVESYLDDWSARRDELGLRESVSRNWWHQDALGQITAGLHMKGLEFVLSEIACLDTQELEGAAQSLDYVLSVLANGIPDLDGAEVDHGSVWWLRRDEDGKEFSEERLREAYERAEPARRVSASKDQGFDAAIGFFSFIKSLRTAVGEALAQDKCLLYIQIGRNEL